MKKTTLIRLVQKNFSTREIAKELGCSQSNVRYWLRKHELKTTPVRQSHKTCVICASHTVRGRRRCNSCNTRVRRHRCKTAAITYKGGQCRECGWRGDIAGFQFHHVGDDKEFDIGAAANRSWEVVKTELDKCELLCATCHHIETAGERSEVFLREVTNYRGRVLEGFV